MTLQVVTPRCRGFVCINAHPDGCAELVRRQIDVATAAAPEGGERLGNVLVLGASTGYGLASLHTAMFAWGASALGVCYERPANPTRTATAGWYNLVATHGLAAEAGRQLATINGDAFSTEVKEQAVDILRERFGPVDLVVYSLAAPRRADPVTGQVWTSALKPINEPYRGQVIDLREEALTEISLEPATHDEIAGTVKVMGGEDWELWIRTLLAAGLLARGARTVAYSYIGPRQTWPIYRYGTIGRAKHHVEETAYRLDELLGERVGGNAWVSVNKAVVTQAAIAIPGVPPYMSLLYRVMRRRGTHEGPIEQALRLFAEHIGPGRRPALDEDRRIRLDDLELDPEVQREVAELWARLDDGNFVELTDWDTFRRELRQIYGFAVPGIDYDEPVEIERALG